MICYEFKGGNGTASRKVEVKTEKAKPGTPYTVGVFVQANCGRRPNLTIAGMPVGKEIPGNAVYSQDTGSIIIVVATDAPLLPNQLKRLARRAALGLARTGSYSGNGFGRSVSGLFYGQPRRLRSRASRPIRCRQSRTTCSIQSSKASSRRPKKRSLTRWSIIAT